MGNSESAENLRVIDDFILKLFNGTTATPERTDIISINYNVADEIRLQKELEEAMQVPKVIGLLISNIMEQQIEDV